VKRATRDPAAAAVSRPGAHLKGGVMKQDQFDRRTFLIAYMLQAFK
jgi:hypothetical protein